MPKIIQIIVKDEQLMGLADDGSVWLAEWVSPNERRWKMRIPPPTGGGEV